MTEREKKMTTVTIGCAIANLLLALAKITAGIVGRSAAMTADAIHSLSDVVCDALVLVMVKISARGKDERHNWGYGKYETIATLAISVLLIVIAVELMTDGISSIREILSGAAVEAPGMIALWVAVISIIVQEGIFQWTVHVGRKVESQTMIANAWHHRSDALSSVGSLIGIGGAILLGGKWTMLDPLVGCLLSILILVIAIKMFFPALRELTDGSLPVEEVGKIRELTAEAGAEAAELRTRMNGHSRVIEVVIAVSPSTTISEADSLTEKIETALKNEFGAESQITVICRKAE